MSQHIPVNLRAFLTTASAAALLAASAPAFAQAPAPEAAPAGAASAAPSAQVQEVVVTGSRIRGAAPVGSTVIGLTRQDIVASTAITTTQLLREVPQVVNLGVSDTSRGQAGGSANITYSQGINLRGIGPYATLTLLNGRRAVGQGTGGQLFDPSAIPTIALQRVEIVADGASAIYGSDAIAGVVNLITRRNFNGVEANLHYGTGDHYDERQLGAIVGHTWGSGQFTLAFENAFHSALSGRDRDFYGADLRSRGGADTRVTQCQPGTIGIGPTTYAIPAGGVTPANASALVAGTTNRCDNLKNADLLPEQEHNSIALNFNQDITDRISVFGDAFALQRNFTFRGGTLAAALTVPRSNAFFVSPVGTNPATQTVGYSFINDFGPYNPSTGSSQAVQGTVGVDVKLPYQWKFEGDYSYGRDNDYSLSYNINNPALNAALASSNPATAFNPFGAANSPAVLANLHNSQFYAPGTTIQQQVEAKFDGPVIHLPGGDFRVALGGEYMSQRIWAGLDSGPPNALVSTRVGGAREVKSGYIEGLIPVFGAENAVPGIRRLDISVAGRIEDYSDFGTTSNPKFGVNWSPLDGFLVRGSYGTSFRAPLLAQTHPASTALYVQNYSDPKSPTGITQGLTLSGAGPNLQPETATTYSVGFDYTPQFLKRAKVSLTYWDIDYRNQLTSYLSNLSILQRESYYSQIITRNPDPAFIAGLVGRYAVNGVLPVPLLLYVNGQTLNLAKSLTQGFDFDITYRQPTDYGDFGFGINGTYLTTYDTAPTSTAPEASQLNTIYNPLRFRTRGNVNWQKAEWVANVFVNYTNGYHNNLVTPTQNVDSYTTVDAALSYTFGDRAPSPLMKGLTLSIDARNLFDAKPPFVNIAESPNGGGGFDPTAADPVGRVIGFTVNKKW